MDQVQGSASSGEFARVCVFCGSSSGKKAIYTEVAEELGTELVRRGIDLVYGGGSIGLMGAVAQAVHDAGGHVVGVIPRALMPKEICGNTVGELVAVDDMHQRKAEMARRADAFIALPGGFGTFEEVLEIITWTQLGIHKKPVGLLNVDGYYDPMLTLFDKALDEGFLNVASHNIVISAPTATELLDKLKNFTPIVDKSVPELTWEASDASASSSPNIDAGTNSAAVYDSNFHLNGHSSRSSGGRASSRAPTMTQTIRTRTAVTNSFRSSSTNYGHFRTGPAGPPPRFSVHSHTSSAVLGFMEWRASGSRSAVGAMRSVDRRLGGAASLGGRVLPLLL